MNITNWQDQIICGTLLGSGYISHQTPTYLGISETRNHDWLNYKKQELESLEAKTPLATWGNVLKWRSQSHPIWSSYADKFYKDGHKKIDMELLDRLRDIALAVWFGDKGFWYSTRRAGLRTTAFGKHNRVISTYFNEVGMPCDVKVDTNRASRIVFSRKGTETFLATVAHRLPEFMYHRLSKRQTPSQIAQDAPGDVPKRETIETTTSPENALESILDGFKD